MIVSGGYDNSYLNTGSILPVTDTWGAISASPLSGRQEHTAVTHMIIWGGYGFGVCLNDGAAYNPATDTWAL